MATTIAILSQKGGTGKTTATRTIADVLRRIGASTLAVDADPQGNLSSYRGVPPDSQPGLGEVLAGQARLVDAVVDDVVPATLGLAEAELLLAGKIGRETTLRNALREAKRRYEYVLIDCPPTLGLLTVNALVASDRALLSTEVEHFSRNGIEQALEVVGIARESLNPQLEPLGILLNIADMRTRHARETVAALERAFPGLGFETAVRRSIAYPESAARCISILDHRPSFGADYVNVTAEMLERLDRPDLARAARQLVRD